MNTCYSPAESALYSLLVSEQCLGADPRLEGEILSLAHRHRVTNLLSPKSFSDDASCETLKQSKLEMAKRQLLFLATLQSLVNKTNQSNLPVIVVKGPDLAFRYYKESYQRMYSDIDLLIDFSKFEGYKLIFAQFGFKLREPTVQTSSCEFFSEKLNLIIDVQDICPQFSTVSSTIEEANLSYKALSNSSLLVYLAIHGSKHLWCRLLWIYDIAQVLSLMSNSELSESYNLARCLKARNKLLVAIELAQRLAKCENLKFPKTSRSIEKLSTALERRIFLTQDNLKVRLSNLYLLMALEDSLTSKLFRAADKIFTPSHADVKNVYLPKPFYRLYSAIRPFRYFHKLLLNRSVS